MRRSALCGIVVVCVLGAITEASSRVAATPVPAATAVRVDGEFGDDVWQQATPITGFRQREPRDGAAATYETDVRIAYDSTALYVAVNALDPEPARIVGFRTRRDEPSPSDWVRVMIDSFHDRRSAFEFAVNPAGVKQDTYWFNDSNADPGWDAVWEVAVSRGAQGWRAEFKIPFSQLRFRPSESATFGLGVVRQIARLNETSTWPLLSKSANGYVSSFGELTGLRLTQSPKRLELVPYAVADVSTQPVQAGSPLANATDRDAALGVDLKYALRPGLTLTGTVNPDFGQVEADPAVVNLSAFETFFSERRPFFVEGSGVFRFDLDCNDGSCSGLFYSRRIGRAPRGSPSPGDRGYAAVPTQTTILGAAKLTGKAGGFSIGALTAVTADEDAVIVNGAARSRQTVEPMTAYSIVRAKREFANQSALGFMVTSTNRRLDSDTRFLPVQAQTGGVDWDWRLKGTYAVQGYWAASSVRGDAGAIESLQRSNVHSFHRPDADHVDVDPARSALNGYGGMLALSKIGGERVRFATNVSFKSPGFDINDLGFQRRADQRSMSNWLQWRHDRPSKYMRTFRVNFNQWASWNYDGDRLFSGININAHATFTNNWATGSGFNINPAGFDDRATRGGPGALGNPERSFWAYLDSDSRRRIFLSVFGFRGADGHASRYSDISPSITWRPLSFLRLTGGLRFGNNDNQSQWIANDEEGRYVFGRLRQRTVAITTRVNYTVTPNLSFQMYAEPFVSAGEYSNFKELVNGRASAYADRYAPFAYAGNPDFNYRSFRTTNVLRWEYRQGSTLFVVWQQGREGSIDRGAFDFRRDFGGIFDASARNVFLVKWAYWLNL